MSDFRQGQPPTGFSQVDPCRVLHLLPSAPQELIVEVYWHLVHRLQAEAQRDPSLRSRLEQLNEAYAAIASRRQRAWDPADASSLSRLADERRAEATSKGPWLRRLFSRQATAQPSFSPSPWELLHVVPSAPPDIVELAYGFCRLRLRSQRGEAAALDLAKLQEAYESLRRRQAAPPAAPQVAQAPVSPPAEVPPYLRAEAPVPVSAPDEVATGEAAAVAPSAPEEPLARTEEEAPSGAVKEIEAAPAPASAEEPVEPKAPRPRPWRPVEALSSSLGRWAADVADSVRERRAASPEEAPADEETPASAEPAQAAVHDAEATPKLSEQAGRASVEERLAALAAARRMAPDGQAPAPSALGEEREAAQPPPPARPAQAIAHLVAEAGPTQEVGATIRSGSFTIGTDPACDFVIPGVTTAESAVLGRIWAQENRFLLHVMAATPGILVNGQPVAWAVLEDGDRLQIGESVLRFQRPPGSGEGG